MKLVDWIDRQPVRVGFGHRGSSGAGPAALATMDTRGEIAATQVSDPSTGHLRTAGFGSTGDGGAALYVRAGSEPLHAGKVRSADGTWWELIPDAAGPTPEQFGATGQGLADDTAPVQDWLDHLSAHARKGVARGTYRLDATVTIPDPDNVHIDATGSVWKTSQDILMIDVNGRADSSYADNESRQNFRWTGGQFNCTAATPQSAAAFRMLGMRKAILAPDRVDGFATGLILGGKDTILIENIKFFNNDIDVNFPPWSPVGGPLLVQIRNLHHSHGGKSTPCVKSYLPLNDTEIMGCSYNLGTNTDCVAIDLQKDVLLAVDGSAGNWSPGETVTGASSGATMVLDEVYDHAFPFQIAQPMRWLVGTDRSGSFVAGETVTGANSAASATIGTSSSGHIVQNPTWKGLAIGGAMHFEAGSAANGAVGVRLRDRIRTGAPSFSMKVDVGTLALNGGGSVGVDLGRIEDIAIQGYFAQQSGNTSVRTDPDCEAVALLPPFRDIGATIDLGGMDRSELNLAAFSRTLPPTSFGSGMTLGSGATPTTATTIPASIKKVIGGLSPVAYDLRVSLTASTASTGTNVRWRAFRSGETAASVKQSLQIAGGRDSELYWTAMRVEADALGEFEFDAQNSGGGTVTVNPQITGVHY